MQDILNLQKLQNLAQLQQPQSQLSGLQGLANLSSAVALNSPLNLSLTGGAIPSSGMQPGNSIVAGLPPQMPQLILASGQLVQGIQGAQLLIPTSQGK